MTIAGVARAVKPDLILMAAHGRDDAGRLVAGPIAKFVRDRAGMPILLVAAGGMPATIPARRAMAQETETVMRERLLVALAGVPMTTQASAEAYAAVGTSSPSHSW